MNKIYSKLIAMALALIVSVSVVIMSSYAWLVLAGNPVVTGIQVAIGGGNTILTAPNVTEVVDGTVYNYPGSFSDKLNFGQQKNYEYLQTLGSLTPVSTYNGIDWFLPAYYSGSDEEVQEGRVLSGQLKDISAFQVDSELIHANLPAEEEDKIEDGSYIYLDFWVVSPGGDYTLRVSTGDEGEAGGSFVIDLLQPTATDDGYSLTYSSGSAAAAVRIGFLANDLTLTDDTMLHYQDSIYFDDRFTSLRGFYQEPDTGTIYSEADHFTIYEPNGDSHPSNVDIDGCYVQTKPLARVDGVTVEQSVLDRVTVQLSSLWAASDKGTETTAIEQRFQAALITMDTEDMSQAEIANSFYAGYLQGQIAPYVKKGAFVKSAAKLYSDLYDYSGVVPASQLAGEERAGATDDVYIIKLEQNVPQRIRMFIWIEGQDVDCVDSVNSSRFAVNIELAGGSE